jgi:CheY-like chemotaxis protein
MKKPFRAIIIDDDEFVRIFVARQLRALGATDIDTCGDSALAISALNDKGPFDLIVCDLMMPTVDGIEILTKIAAVGPRSAIILVSSLEPNLLDIAGNFAKSKGLNLVGTIQKPVALDKLDDLLKQAAA